MSDRNDFPDAELPPELAALDAELSSIRYEERPSFAPELGAELARSWLEGRARRRWPVSRLMAAGVAGLCMVGLGVPSARAALVRLVDVVRAPLERSLEPVGSPGAPVAPFDASPASPEGFSPVPPRLHPEMPVYPAPEREYEGPLVTFPEMRDRAATEEVIQRNYPIALQRQGVGGTVRLLLWVDSVGAVDVANIARGSGIPALDRAALQVAPSFRFEPARRRGKAVATWVEFDVRFEPLVVPGEGDVRELPRVEAVSRPSDPDFGPEVFVPEWREPVALPAPGRHEAGEALRRAIHDDALVRRLGPIEAILKGDPPGGLAPTQWRSEVSDALEAAIVRAPDNPAPFLALARIRRKQGLRTEARVLYERGLQRAQRAGADASPIVLAGLHYERGLLIREGLLGSRAGGRVRADALPAQACPQARSSGQAASGYASTARLIAWNYLCPEALGTVFETSFETTGVGADGEAAVMMASFRSAVEAYPAHTGANIEILLELADGGRWGEVLDGARRFTRASNGNPYGLLLVGLALQRLSRTEEAEEEFRLALRQLPAEEVGELEDISKLLDPSQSAQYWKGSGAGREAWIEAFWDRLDPILSTPVNERRVEHLARAAYAHLRFGSALSDPGEVWVRYGRPSQVRAVAEGSGLRTEFWDYGSGPDITFRRVGASETMNLTSEGRAYIEELRQVFPHRYGTGSRLVFSLAGQVARFRGEGAGASDVEVHTRVPALPASMQQDTLYLNVFLLDAEGAKLDMVQRLIPAEPAPISLEAPVEPAVSDVVVEVFNRRTGQAAALRDSVHAAASGGGAAISDLLLTDPATATSGVERGARWLRPLTLADPVTSHELGVLFELYDVSALSPWYRLRAEAVREGDGAVTTLRIRPADQKDSRPTWDRRPAGAGPTAEFLNVWIGDLPAGSYRLRVVADLPEARGSMVAERRFERR